MAQSHSKSLKEAILNWYRTVKPGVSYPPSYLYPLRTSVTTPPNIFMSTEKLRAYYCILTGHHHETTINNNTSNGNLRWRYPWPEIFFNSWSCNLHTYYGEIIKLNARGSGSAGLDVDWLRSTIYYVRQYSIWLLCALHTSKFVLGTWCLLVQIVLVASSWQWWYAYFKQIHHELYINCCFQQLML